MDSLIIHLNNVSANDKARDIYNLAYLDSPENRKNFEAELQKIQEEDNYLLKAAMRAQYIQVYRIATSFKPQDWSRKLLIKYKIIEEFER